jgi:hypothetical protein
MLWWLLPLPWNYFHCYFIFVVLLLLWIIM